MNKYIEILKHHVAENPPNYGDGDAHTILDMLYCYYHECNSTDNDAVKRYANKIWHYLLWAVP